MIEKQYMRSVTHAFRSRHRLLTGLLFVFLFFLFLQVVRDYDTWWHLAIGRSIVSTRTIPIRDIFSFSLPSYPYAYQAWLQEIILYVIYTMSGLWGISAFYASMSAVGYIFLLQGARYRIPRIPFVLIVFFASVMTYVVFARTQTVTFLFLALTVWLYAKASSVKHPIRILWVLPFVTMVWANMHGGFILGVLLIFILTVYALPYGNVRSLTHATGHTKEYLVIAATAILTTILNPYGLNIHIQAIRMVTDPTIARFNLDWAPLLVNRRESLVMAMLLTVLTACLIISHRISRRKKYFLAALYVLSLASRRFVILNMTLIIPEALILWSPFIVLWQKKIVENPISLLPVTVATIAFLIVPFTHGATVVSESFRVYPDPVTYATSDTAFVYPYGAVAYMKENGVPERLLNNFNWGGYLIWNFPGARFFIDGRMDAFFINNRSFLGIYQDIISQSERGKVLFNAYGFNGVLAPKTYVWPLVSLLRGEPTWRIAFEDTVSILFLKRSDGRDRMALIP